MLPLLSSFEAISHYCLLMWPFLWVPIHLDSRFCLLMRPSNSKRSSHYCILLRNSQGAPLSCSPAYLSFYESLQRGTCSCIPITCQLTRLSQGVTFPMFRLLSSLSYGINVKPSNSASKDTFYTTVLRWRKARVVLGCLGNTM